MDRGGTGSRVVLGVVVCAASVTCLGSAAASAAGSSTGSVRLIRVFGIARRDTAPGPLRLALEVSNSGHGAARLRVSGWLLRSAGGRLISLALSPSAPRSIPAGKARTFELSASLPSSVRSGTYRLRVCITQHRPARGPPARGCVTSERFSIASGIVPIKIVLGTKALTITPALDSSRAATALIGASGGSLSVTTVDGSKLTLTIPANAVAGDEQITMTPIASLGGSGLSLVAGVQLQPDGLVPLKGLTLSVTQSRSIPISQQVAFAYQGSGSQFGLVPLALQRSITIPVAQFGGIGVAQATPAQLAAQKARTPSDPQAAFLQQLAVAIYGLRQQRAAADTPLARIAGGSTPTGGDPAAQVAGVLAGFYYGYVLPAVQTASTSVDALTHAMEEYSIWKNMVLTSPFYGQLAAEEATASSELFGKALPERWGTAVSGCRGIGQVAALRVVVELGRIAQATGESQYLGGDGAIEQAIADCSELSLSLSLLTSTTTWTANPENAGDFPISSDQVDSSTGPVPLQEQPGSGNDADVFTFQSANAPVSETIVNYTVGSTIGSVCTVSPPVVNTDPSVTYISFKATLTIPPDLFALPTDLPSTLDVETSGADQMNSTLNCQGQITAYSVSTQAMRTISYITQGTPVRLTDAEPSSSFSDSFVSPVGSLQGSYTGTGTITLETP